MISGRKNTKKRPLSEALHVAKSQLAVLISGCSGSVLDLGLMGSLVSDSFEVLCVVAALRVKFFYHLAVVVD